MSDLQEIEDQCEVPAAPSTLIDAASAKQLEDEGYCLIVGALKGKALEVPPSPSDA